MAGADIHLVGIPPKSQQSGRGGEGGRRNPDDPQNEVCSARSGVLVSRWVRGYVNHKAGVGYAGRYCRFNALGCVLRGSCLVCGSGVVCMGGEGLQFCREGGMLGPWKSPN